MNRRLAPLLLLAFSSLAFAQGTVDLDAPGALDALKRDQPQHYLKLVEALQRAKVTPYVPKDASLNARKPAKSGEPAEPAGGARTKMTIPVENAQYRITVVRSPS